MGAVYVADQLDMQRPVVVKVIRPEWAGDEQVVARFRAEARIVARLSHPNVVQVFATGEVDGALWMAMEYVDGETLGDAVREVGRFDEVRASAIGEQIAAALAAAHAAGVVHRDLKPANVMLSALPGRADHVKVLDFGIARAVDGGASMDGHLTGTGVLVGTPAYMSPEQIEGHPLDGRSDLYALGLILYEMVSGTHPFDARTPVQWVLQHLQTPAPALADRAPGVKVSPGFDAIVRRCLAKRANERFESAEHVRRALAELVSEASRPVVTQRTGSVPAPPVARRPQAGLQLAVVLVGVVALLAAAAWGLSRVLGSAIGDGPVGEVAADATGDTSALGEAPPPGDVDERSDAGASATPEPRLAEGDAAPDAEPEGPDRGPKPAREPSTPSPAPVVVAVPDPPPDRPKPTPNPVVAPAPTPNPVVAPAPTRGTPDVDAGFGPSYPARRPGGVRTPAAPDLSRTTPARAGGAPLPGGAVFESDLGTMRSWRIRAPMDDVVGFYQDALEDEARVSFRRHDATYAAAMHHNPDSGWNLLGVYDEPEGVRITVFIR